ncbi:leader peptidase (prepilin peptidase)/N-methyltransferase [Curtobacterium sp. PhB137]|uniref:prepilin peptidase n=1 Tax=Curtobacterium sp. PhB137 TaxID=2485182 RepID=UPI000F4EB82E|nr:A24 family peptidase [Curtobacterium sp. PhB137]RPE84436.1 leader peptidase (prepilin peptidase)/N-methyltransferase [Curtobacterium sp. PhB137]
MTAAVMVVGFAAATGLAIGSFLNVVVHRVPAGLSVVAPASACPRCGHEIRARDNVPVLSWAVLRGRCRDCAEPISVRYPLVELATAVLFALVVLQFGPALLAATDARAAAVATTVLVAMLYLMAVSVALALIDLDVHRLPNAIVLPAYPVLAALLTAASALSGDWGALLRAGAGLLVLGGGYLVLALAVPGGMGLGDVKLAGVLGLVLAYLGWGPLAVGAFGAFVLGGSFAIGLMVAGRAKRGSGIPFGPWMLGGAWLGVFIGQSVLDGYLRIIGLA